MAEYFVEVGRNEKTKEIYVECISYKKGSKEELQAEKNWLELVNEQREKNYCIVNLAIATKRGLLPEFEEIGVVVSIDYEEGVVLAKKERFVKGSPEALKAKRDLERVINNFSEFAYIDENTLRGYNSIPVR